MQTRRLLRAITFGQFMHETTERRKIDVGKETRTTNLGNLGGHSMRREHSIACGLPGCFRYIELATKFRL